MGKRPPPAGNDEVTLRDNGFDLLRASELGRLCQVQVTKQAVLQYRHRGLIEADAVERGEFRFARWRVAIIDVMHALKRRSFLLEEILVKVWPRIHGRDGFERLAAMSDEELLFWLREQRIEIPKRKPR